MEELYGFPNKNPKNYEAAEADLLKYFHRPVRSKFHCGDIITENDEESVVCLLESCMKTEKKNSVKKSKGTQTDYRESAVQTDPWDPPLKVVEHHKETEILLLKKFSYGNGLPVSMLELDYITETLKNKNLIDELEKTNDDVSLKKKKEVLSNQVEANWNYKIAAETQLQRKKLDQMKASIIKEFREKSEKREQILKNMWNRKKDEIKKQNEKLKDKLSKELKSIENKFAIKEKCLASSSIFGVREEKPASQNISDSKFSEKNMDYILNNYFSLKPGGLSSIKDWLEKNDTVLKNENEVPLPRLTKRTEREQLAEEAYQSILSKKRTKLPPKVYHEDYEKTETPLPSMKPDDVVEYLKEEESKVDMVTVWQQVLRGLAYQKQMLELIERHKAGLSTSSSDIS